CRHAEDCAIVMQAIARRDGRDMSVSDVPFNWDAQLDLKKLRVGWIKESFDELTNADAKQNAGKTLETLRALGITTLVPVAVPALNTNVGGLGVESAVFFDQMMRGGRMTGARGGRRRSAWLVPAVEYLQSQRVRMMMMMKLAEATAGLDLYIVASNNTGGSPGRGGGRGGGPETTDPAAPAEAGRRGGGARGAGGGRGRGGGGPQSPTQRHFAMANLAGYPAINVPNGFGENGQPTNVTFYARPFGETALIALAKAYQDASGFHLRRPARLDA
ncbi:MAG TPA: amidase family protein, partial [Vicinamibacterales bacterium]|nr:amidase family protein [Vicinamibacterales bacterium]